MKFTQWASCTASRVRYTRAMATPPSVDDPPLSRRAPEERRARIVSAAARLFAERGYEETGVADIAAEAGVAVGTVYRFFPDKPSLEIGVILDRKRQIAERIDALGCAASGSLASRVEAQVAGIVGDLLSGGGTRFEVDRQRLAALGPAASAAFGAVDEAINRWIDQLAGKGLSRRPDPALAASFIAAVVLDAARAAADGRALQGAAAQEAAEMIVRYLAP